MKRRIVGAAFRHQKTGEIVNAGPFHDYNVLEEQGRNPEEYEDGFVDAAGRFLTRKQARRRVGADFAHDIFPEGSEEEADALDKRGQISGTTLSASYPYDDAAGKVACGDCYCWAYKYVTQKGGTLVHGTMTDPWSGNRYVHAWVEHDGRALDWLSNQMNSPYKTVEGFLTFWKPRDVTRYTADEARVLAVRTRHFGPW